MYNGVYPAYIKPYTQVKPKQIQRKSEEEQTPQQEQSNRGDNFQRGGGQNVRPTSYSLPGYRKYQAQIQRHQQNVQNNAVQPQKVGLNAVNPNAQNINVSQILTDFRSTANAVGAPKNITEEVGAYLDLIQTQAEKEVPNKKIIQSNLKNASQVLDGYISKTLNTQSNVVENWVDALFLQNIDYKADPNAINEEMKLHLESEEQEAQKLRESRGESVKAEVKEQAVQSTNRNYIPSDEKMKSLFIQAKRSASESDTKTALIALKSALNYAQQTEDTKMQSMIYYETADLYNKNGQYSQALKGYKIAADMATDENLIAKSYMKTGKIYDEAGLLEPAKQHWLSAIGFAGESENLPLQVKALDNLAEVQSEVFDSKNAYMFTNLANSIAEETKDDKVKGYAYKRAFNVSDYLDDKSKAMQYLKLSTKAYTNAQDDKNVINNYMAAADIMLNVGNQTKARALLNKAFMTALDSDNKEFLPEISSKIAKLAA